MINPEELLNRLYKREKEGYYEDTIIIAAIGTLAMEYTMRKVECTFSDYSEFERK